MSQDRYYTVHSTRTMCEYSKYQKSKVKVLVHGLEYSCRTLPWEHKILFCTYLFCQPGRSKCNFLLCKNAITYTDETRDRVSKRNKTTQLVNFEPDRRTVQLILNKNSDPIIQTSHDACMRMPEWAGIRLN